MKSTISIVLGILLLQAHWAKAQAPVVVAQTTIKVAASDEVVLYYGFAAGDKVGLQFSEQNGKELKEISITPLNAQSPIFKAYQTSFENNQHILIPQQGIYCIKLVNSALLSGRICQLSLQRTPASAATALFNTQVYQKTVYDTTYEYRTQWYTKQDTSIVTVSSTVAKVHSMLNKNGNKTISNVVLPPNTVAWSYYIGVDQEGQEAYQKATTNLANTAGKWLSHLPGYGPLAALAMGSASYLTQLQKGEDVDYYILNDSAQLDKFTKGLPLSYLKKGKVINDFARMPPMKGNLFFCLQNDNAVLGISVLIKVVAIQVQQVQAQRTEAIPQRLTPRQIRYLQNN
jgi:hypothetical protein